MKKTLLTALTTLCIIVGSTVNAKAVDVANKDVPVTLKVDTAITLTLSTNSINFGDVSPNKASYECSEFTATVQSNNNYNLGVCGTDLVAGENKIPVSKLSIKADGGEYKALSNIHQDILTNQPLTSGKAHKLMLKFTTDWMNKPGNYTSTLTFKAKQA